MPLTLLRRIAVDYVCPSHLEAPHLHQCMFEGRTEELNGTMLDPHDPTAGTYFAKRFDASEVTVAPRDLAMTVDVKNRMSSGECKNLCARERERDIERHISLHRERERERERRKHRKSMDDCALFIFCVFTLDQFVN